MYFKFQARSLLWISRINHFNYFSLLFHFVVFLHFNAQRLDSSTFLISCNISFGSGRLARQYQVDCHTSPPRRKMCQKDFLFISNLVIEFRGLSNQKWIYVVYHIFVEIDYTSEEFESASRLISIQSDSNNFSVSHKHTRILISPVENTSLSYFIFRLDCACFKYWNFILTRKSEREKKL